jgi:N-acetyl-1-D-myo-inositol-2-amino-2-deoxy-alpha-D-glucopyranoside deacetylase
MPAPAFCSAWLIAKVYWTAFPVSVMRAGIEMLKAAGEDTGFAAQDPDEIPFACPDELVTTAIDGGEFAEQKMRALRAHATQISTEEGFFALSNNIGSQVMGTEYYRLVAGTLAEPFDAMGRETDLFNGISTKQ